jgi:hypothetical protein
MAHPSSRHFLIGTLLNLSISVCIGACSSSDTGLAAIDGGGRDTASSGGSTGFGGTTSVPGIDGSVGGAGGRAIGSGGTSGSGGMANLGGTPGSGGSGAGGANATGGAIASGGATGTGGKTGTGGSSAKGGTTGTGGSSAKGGTTGTGGSSALGGTTGTGGSSGVGDYGFTFTIPGSIKETCTAEMGVISQDVPDADWLCTLHLGAKTAYVYAQSNASGATCIMSLVPTFTATAQLSVDGVVSDLANAQYDWGGNHHNDSLKVDYQGKTYKYYHSSFGFGWRKCASMDCVNVYPEGSTTLQTEGCASARTLPEVCVSIKADGTHDPLVDTFKKCVGDPNT